MRSKRKFSTKPKAQPSIAERIIETMRATMAPVHARNYRERARQKRAAKFRRRLLERLLETLNTRRALVLPVDWEVKVIEAQGRIMECGAHVDQDAAALRSGS